VERIAERIVVRIFRESSPCGKTGLLGVALFTTLVDFDSLSGP